MRKENHRTVKFKVAKENYIHDVRELGSIQCTQMLKLYIVIASGKI
jgi:hypothetical protein